jgi:hypothetical protein
MEAARFSEISEETEYDTRRINPENYHSNIIRRWRLNTSTEYKEVKQSRYRPGVVQSVPGI